MKTSAGRKRSSGQGSVSAARKLSPRRKQPSKKANGSMTRGQAPSKQSAPHWKSDCKPRTRVGTTEREAGERTALSKRIGRGERGRAALSAPSAKSRSCWLTGTLEARRVRLGCAEIRKAGLTDLGSLFFLLHKPIEELADFARDAAAWHVRPPTSAFRQDFRNSPANRHGQFGCRCCHF